MRSLIKYFRETTVDPSGNDVLREYILIKNPRIKIIDGRDYYISMPIFIGEMDVNNFWRMSDVYLTNIDEDVYTKSYARFYEGFYEGIRILGTNDIHFNSNNIITKFIKEFPFKQKLIMSIY